MTLLIDGHNLIGAGVFRDIRLRDEDDEAKLVARLKIWRSRIRRKIVVFFDRGIPGGRDHRMSGAGVEVVFAANPTEADDLIRRRLQHAARNMVLVSNDDALARTAEANGIERWRGDEFVARMALRMPDLPTPEAGEEWHVHLSPQEVDEWMELFQAKKRARRAKRRAEMNGGDPDKGRAAQARKKSTTKKQPISLRQEFEEAVERKPAKLPKQSRRKARQAARARKRLSDSTQDGRKR